MANDIDLLRKFVADEPYPEQIPASIKLLEIIDAVGAQDGPLRVVVSYHGRGNNSIGMDAESVKRVKQWYIDNDTNDFLIRIAGEELNKTITYSMETLLEGIRAIPPSNSTVIGEFAQKLLEKGHTGTYDAVAVIDIVDNWPDACQEGKDRYLESVGIQRLKPVLPDMDEEITITMSRKGWVGLTALSGLAKPNDVTESVKNLSQAPQEVRDWFAINRGAPINQLTYDAFDKLCEALGFES